MKAMHFGGTLHKIIHSILAVDQELGPIYLSKLDLTSAYMHLWLRLEDTLVIAFLYLKKKWYNPQLVVFYISLHIGFRDLVPYLCMVT